ncbi:MAG: hypothetical protein M3R25_07635, partial [Bacteroidota bacterium]|nr:hypothetical protein [Bacteroidota bacterium]
MRLLIAAILFMLITANAEGQPRSFLQQLPQDTVVDVFVTLDWKALERKKMDKAYIPATAHVGAVTGAQEMNLKVKTRGHMRLSICAYPPLKLKFNKSDLSLRACSDMNEMDLVHPCHNGEAYDQFLLREYLAYKLYRLLSPYSFETRLIRMHYLNSDKTEEHEPTYAFLVENEEELVDRLNGKRYNSSTISRNSIEHESYLLMSLFQFMIGNTDWHMPSRHNLEFIVIQGHPLLISVPFDFDYSGLVSAPYA